MEKYEILQKLGEGTYGKVYKAVDNTTGQLVAIKKSRLDMDEDGIPPTLLRETSLLQLLSSSIYIVRLLQIHFIDSDSDHNTHGHSSSSSSSCRLTTCNKVPGTPTEREWPGVTSLPAGWRASYPHWNPQSLALAFLSLNPQGVDLLSKMLRYNPVERISAKAAMDHPFFDTLDKSQF